MTSEALVREAVDAFNRADRAAVERLLAPDFELRSPLSDMRGSPYEGHDGAYLWFDDLSENFAGLDTTIDEVVDVRGDRVLGLGRARVAGRTSGLDYEQPVALVIDVADSRIRRIWVMFDHEEARRRAAELG